jgi:hypothetical protein
MEFKKRLLIAISIPATISLVLLIAIFFLASDIGNLANKIYQTRKDINFGLQAINSLAGLRQDYEQAKIYMPEVGGILPSKDQLLSFSKDMNTMAKLNQVSLNLNIGQENRPAASQLTQIDVSTAGQGTFNNLLSFLKTVENSRYFIKFGSLDFQQANYNASLNLSGKIISL